VRLRHEGGFWRWFDVVATDHTGDEDLTGIVVTAREITDRKLAEERLTASEARFRSLVQHASDLVLVLEGRSSVRYASPSFERLLGRPAGAIVDRELLSIAHPEDQRDYERCLEVLEVERMARTELRLRHADGSWRTFDATLTDLREEPAVAGIVLNAHDVTDRKALEGDLRYRVLHDDLTGLASRALLRERLERALTRRRQDGVVDAILFIDLDDFKTINDSLGHAAGDVILQVVAHRISASVRPNETAARLGGDEFALLVEMGTEDTANEIAHRILEVLADPIEMAGRQYVVGASIGIALASADGLTAEVMLRDADAAMYYAKRRGKGRIEVFDERMHVDASERLELKADLAHAVERGELVVYYQQIVDVDTSRIAGFEALVRWQHPERGLVAPGSFIPLAEETGVIATMGRWLFDVSLRQLAEWQALGRRTGHANLDMSINVSARQLEDADIVTDLERALEASGVEPGHVTIELTESCAVATPEALERLLRIRELGVNLAMDDFGTGEASYAALARYPFTCVKVDRTILLGLGGPNHDRALAQLSSIVNLAREMGLVSVAEGVEGAQELAILHGLGFDKAQGFFFSRPVPAADARDQLLGMSSQELAS
jgi:diguanylate cyclase (GGDEF)-like protein/PAS domain S-box-containing protein